MMKIFGFRIIRESTYLETQKEKLLPFILAYFPSDDIIHDKAEKYCEKSEEEKSLYNGFVNGAHFIKQEFLSFILKP